MPVRSRVDRREISLHEPPLHLAGPKYARVDGHGWAACDASSVDAACPLEGMLIHGTTVVSRSRLLRVDSIVENPSNLPEEERLLAG